MSQKKCNRCGTIVEMTDRFCPKCGSPEFTNIEPVVSAPAQPTTVQPTYQPPVQTPPAQQPPIQQSPMQQAPYVPQMQQPYIPQQPVYNQPVAASKQKKGLKWWQIALIAVAALLVLIIAIGSIGGDEPTGNSGGGNNYTPDYSYNDSPNSVANKTKTVMVYMVGSDLESQNGAASVDIVEMMESGVDTTKNKVLIYTGGTKEWLISDIPVDKNCIYLLEGEEFELVKDYSSLNMGDSQTLAEFVRYGVSNYQSDEYGLILWNHGAGPLVGYGIDELHGDLLEMSELKSALSSAGFGNSKKLEFLGFDACLMGSIETAWEVKDYANYLIASQETEPGCGWDYSFLKQLNHYDSGKDIGKCIVDSYFVACEKIARENPAMESDLTLSCMDLSRIGKVENSLNNLFSKVDSNILTGYFPEASQYRNNVKSFGKYASSFEYDLIDISHLVSLLSDDYSTEAKQLSSDLKEFICYSKSNVSNASGVSIYHPYDNAQYMNAWISQFKSMGFASKYASYISNFGSMLSKPSSSSWNLFGNTKGSAVKKGSNNELSIQLTEEQRKNYASSAYYILKKIDAKDYGFKTSRDDEYMFIFGGFDTQLDSSGRLSASYNNKAVFAVNDKTKEVSNAPITMYQVRDGSGEQKYCASAIFWLFADEITDWKTDPVEWQIKIENGTPKTLGAYLIEGNNGEEIPQKQLLDYKEYSAVEFSFSTRIPKKDTSGNLLPYFEWESTQNFFGNQYDVAEGFHLECREIDNKEDYFVMFVVKDIQGNSYASDMFALPN